MNAPIADADWRTGEGAGAWAVFRRGVAASPELRPGLVMTVIMGLAVALGRLSIPIALQRAIDDGITTTDSGTDVDLGQVVTFVLIAVVVVLVSAAIAAWAQRRLVHTAEAVIYGLRTRAFDHVHRLSLADHVDTSRGIFLARVTSDVEALARFVQWGLLSWTIGPAVILGVLAVLAWYSWQLALIVFLAFVPTVPVLRWIQVRQLAAYDEVRASVADLLGEANEAITGAATIRAYDVGDRSASRIGRAAERRYRAGLRRNRYMAAVFSIGDLFGSIALAAAFAFGMWQRDRLGLSGGELVAVLFLITLLNEPVGELGETTDQTQEAIAGWRKVLDLLDAPIDVAESEAGATLPDGPLSIDAEGLEFSYRTGGRVLHGVDVSIPAGTSVAVVGETGSGKTTFAKLLCRLADPTSGTIRLGGVDLSSVAPASRLRAVRMVPQDGFLFDTTLRANLRFGRDDATDADLEAAVDRLDLRDWVDGLPDGLDSPVGPRGQHLSVGERQLVALIRAALADPGLLILDEATSAVDPETDAALTRTLRRLAAGRTVVSIAHRLATAEASDLVVVFDAGRIAEVGPHHELAVAGGPYQRLHEAWVGNTTSSSSSEGASS